MIYTHIKKPNEMIKKKDNSIFSMLIDFTFLYKSNLKAKYYSNNLYKADQLGQGPIC